MTEIMCHLLLDIQNPCPTLRSSAMTHQGSRRTSGALVCQGADGVQSQSKMKIHDIPTNLQLNN